MSGANEARGEAAFVIGGASHVVRPSFAALVAAETELGPLLSLVDRAADGQLTLAEMAALIWHCLAERDGLAREQLGEALVAQGVSAALPAVRAILRQALSGSA
ncbi:MAG: gene transfer agent family protein [Sphingobium sp.]|nr:gene transfer agent family protein [Sphingobium sp.]